VIVEVPKRTRAGKALFARTSAGTAASLTLLFTWWLS
jgi:hypothetical protein